MNYQNKYNLIKEIGKGGFSTTYLAENQNSDQYAVKKIKIERDDSKLLRAIEKEVQFIEKISHPNIPRFFEYFTITDNNYIEINIVQEFIDGENLYQIINNGKNFNQNEVITILLQVAKILEFLHNFDPSVIHRDIKPSNIMINKTGKIFLIDFGAIKEKITFEYTSKSGLSTIIGTQGYMPIEQFEGRANLSSDIYSLGLTAIYLLSKKEPLQLPRKGLKINFENHINVSKRFSEILEKMIDPDYTLRYKSISQLKKDLYNIDSKSIVLANKNVQTIKSFLNSDEDILLTKNPKLSYILRRNNVVSLITVGFFMCLSSSISLTLFMHLLGQQLSLPVYSISLVLIIIQMLISVSFLIMPYIAYKFARETNYVLTDKRLMIIPLVKKRKATFLNLPLRIVTAISKSTIVFHSIKKILLELPTILIRVLEYNNNPDEIKKITEYFDEVRYINYEDLKSFHIERIEYKDGSGDLNFYHLKDGEKDIFLKLVSIIDVKSVEKAIVDQIKNV